MLIIFPSKGSLDPQQLCQVYIYPPSPTADKSSTGTSSYTASFKVVSEPQAAVPGGASSLDLPTTNSWGFNSWLFFEVSVPVLNRDEVELDEQMDGDQIPVLTFKPNEGWTRIEKKD